MKKYIDSIKKINIENLTYIFWGIYIFMCFLNTVGIIFINDKCQLILKLVRYVCYIEFFAKIIYDWRHGEKITISIIFMAIVSLAIAIIANNNSVLFTLLVLIGLRKLEFDRLIKITLKIFAISFIIVIFSSLIGIIPNWTFSRGDTPRYALGFIYATDAIGMYLVIILMYFYTKRNNVVVSELLLLEAINVFIYNYTDGRVSFILISLLLLIQYLSGFTFARNVFFKPIVQKGLKMVCHTLPIILFLGLHFLIFMYANNNFIANKTNDVLSNRIKYTYNAYKKYDINLFGNDIDWNGWGAYGYKETTVSDEDFKYNFIDSSYASIVFDYGLVFSCIVLLGYRKILVDNLEKKNYWLVLVIIFVLLWSFIEQYIVNLGKNVFVLALIPLLELGEIKTFNYQNLKKLTKNKHSSYYSD